MIASLLSALHDWQAGMNVTEYTRSVAIAAFLVCALIVVCRWLFAPKPEVITGSNWKTPEQEMRERVEQLERRRLHGLTHANLVPFRPHHDDRRVN